VTAAEEVVSASVSVSRGTRVAVQSFGVSIPESLWSSIFVFTDTGTGTDNFLRQLPKFLYLLEYSVDDGSNHDLSLLSRGQRGITIDS
jgi:hypothetical protein